MDFLINFKKKSLKRENARLFNSDMDLFYDVRDIKILFLEEEKEIENETGDIVIHYVVTPTVISTLDVYSSLESLVSTAQALKSEILKVPISPDIKVGDLGTFVLERLQEKYKGSTIVNVEL